MTDAIDEFWRWFTSAEPRLRTVNLGPADVAEVSKKVERLGIERWEIGPSPSDDAKVMFAFSPSSDPELLLLTEEIVRKAPALSGWDFFPAKPRKAWERTFRWSVNKTPIEAGEWKFALFQYEDGQIEIVLLGPVLEEFYENERKTIVHFALESELGELLLMTKICGIDIDTSPSEEMVERAVSMSDLFAAVSASLD